MWARVIGVMSTLALSACGSRTGLLDDGRGLVDASVDGARPRDAGVDARPRSDALVPRDAAPPPPVPLSLSLGFTHSCALISDGSVWCWGANRGELGDGTLEPRLLPTRSHFVDAVQLSASFGMTCIVDRGGAAWCSGGNYGPEPVRVLPDRIMGISGNTVHRCAIRRSESEGGRILCWGGYDFRRGPDGRCSPAQVRAEPTPFGGLSSYDFVEVDVSQSHACARDSTGGVRCWGCNTRGQLGDGTGVEREAPTRVLFIDDAEEVAVSEAYSCARRRSGEVWCWGGDEAFPISLGGAEDVLSPLEVATMRGARSLSASNLQLCGVKDDAKVWCMGSVISASSSGCSGTATPPGEVITLPMTDVRRSAVGEGWQACAILEDDSIQCLGCNGSGEVGDGTRTPRVSPTVVWPP